MRTYTFPLLLLFCNGIFAQADTARTDTSYRGLPLKTYYKVTYDIKVVKGIKTYLVDGEQVGKYTYESLQKTSHENYASCNPCILVYTDVNDHVFAKEVLNNGCNTGFAIEYYANGNPKVIGNYRLNEQDDLLKDLERVHCSLKHGIWTYFDENRKFLYNEYWENDVRIK